MSLLHIQLLRVFELTICWHYHFIRTVQVQTCNVMGYTITNILFLRVPAYILFLLQSTPKPESTYRGPTVQYTCMTNDSRISRQSKTNMAPCFTCERQFPKPRDSEGKRPKLSLQGDLLASKQRELKQYEQ